MNDADDGLISFADDALDGALPAQAVLPPWPVLIVDDDADVHSSTEFALQDLLVLDRPLSLLHAYSAAEAIELLRGRPDIAAILLDVVMETENAGLEAVAVIRQSLQLTHPRIILRTGQPGSAPEMETIQRYDINDYKTKSELTRNKLFTALTSALRSYDQLRRLDASRRGLEQIVAASNRFISVTGLSTFAHGVITQIASFIDVEPEGLVCICAEEGQPRQLRIIAAGGRFAGHINAGIEAIGEPEIAASIARCIAERRTLIGEHSLTLFFPGNNLREFAAYIAAPGPLPEVDRHLLEVFCANIGICGDNIELVERLRKLAYVDQLLGIPNRRAFVEAIDQRLDEGCPTDCVVALVDVDQFAETNDAFGHAYGDRLLAGIAQRLTECLGSDCLVARIANDTFGVLGEGQFVRPEVLRPLFHAPLDIDGIEQPVSMSIGLVKLHADTIGGNDLLKDASIALKRAKGSGQGQYAYYSQDVAVETRERTRLLHDLRTAFKQENLFVVYQPQFDLASGRPIGVEALTRWRTESGDFVSPERFIPIAEQSGLIVALGSWVLRTALHALNRLHAKGHRRLRMAVNVSAVQFRQPGFLDVVEQALHECGIPPDSLELEITESVAIMGFDAVERLMRELKARGIAVAIDDFGTGYSSLSYLGRLPVDRIKIDRAFVNVLDPADSECRVAEMVVPLGHRLGMKVLAEGVESAEQVHILRRYGCDEVQGYLFAKPMPIEELESWLSENPG